MTANLAKNNAEFEDALNRSSPQLKGADKPKKNKKRKRTVDEATEAYYELGNWTDRLVRWLGKNRNYVLRDVVNLPTLFPDWTIGDEKVFMYCPEVILQVVMVIFKDYDSPMSFTTYKSLLTDYKTIDKYALALSRVVPPNIVTPRGTKRPPVHQ
jgi:hypothetical protein